MPRLMLALVLPVLLLGVLPAAAAERLTVFAAASLTDVLTRLGARYEALHPDRPAPVFSFAASSALARQIESGAPADVFVSADLAWMDYLEKAGLLAEGSRRVIAGNRLALIAPADSPVRLQSLDRNTDLAALLGDDGRLAVGARDSVPAGLYAAAALDHLGLSAALAGRYAEAENVRAALALVSRGEAPLGIVYETDARADPAVRIVALFPEDSHPPIVYPAARLKTGMAGAEDFLGFLVSPEAQEVLTADGFSPAP